MIFFIQIFVCPSKSSIADEFGEIIAHFLFRLPVFRWHFDKPDRRASSGRFENFPINELTILEFTDARPSYV